MEPLRLPEEITVFKESTLFNQQPSQTQTQVQVWVRSADQTDPTQTADTLAGFAAMPGSAPPTIDGMSVARLGACGVTLPTNHVATETDFYFTNEPGDGSHPPTNPFATIQWNQSTHGGTTPGQGFSMFFVVGEHTVDVYTSADDPPTAAGEVATFDGAFGVGNY